MFQLLRRNLRFHRRANFAVLLGVAVGTAVLTGALLVGDSLRGSLRERALRRLAGVHFLMMPGRFVEFTEPIDVAQPRAILIPATVSVTSNSSTQRFRNVQLLGTTWKHWYASEVLEPYTLSWRFWEAIPALRPRFSSTYMHEAIEEYEIIFSPTFARQLGVQDGDEVDIRLPKHSSISRESALGAKSGEDLTITTTLVARIRSNLPLTSFDPYQVGADDQTAIVSLDMVQKTIGLRSGVNLVALTSDLPTDFKSYVRNIASLKDYGLTFLGPDTRVNGLFRLTLPRRNLLARDYRGRVAEVTVQSVDVDNDKSLSREEFTTYFTRRGTIDLESESLLLPPAAEQAAHAAAKDLNIPATSTLVYLANSISDGVNEIPYSVIAAVEPQLPAPLGPYLDPSEPPLGDDEILLVEWPESPLAAKRGDTITIRYFLPESDGKSTEASATFKLRGKVPLTGIGADPYLAPEFPGITDKLTLADWNPPFPYDNTKIKRRDEDFWDKYRATPKAYVNQAVGRKLFGSRFGYATSVRFAATSEEDAKRINDKLLEKLKPEDFGLVFEDVRAKALASAEGGTDFGGLFLGFSFFLIAGALMLVSLLWKLNLERRASEIGLLFAAGFRLKFVRRLLLFEGLWVATFGALLGLLLAIGYCQLMLKMLAALWPEEGMASFLALHVEMKTLVIGFAGMMLLTGITIWWSLRSLRRVAPAMLLRGVYHAHDDSTQPRKARVLRFAAPALAALGVIATIAGIWIHEHEARAGAFFSGGGLLLIAGLLAFRQYLRREGSILPANNLLQLGRRNVARNPTRSLLTAGLIASATFLLVAVESFRRQPAADFHDRKGGSGGYDLIATMDVPLYQDLDDPATGRKEMLDALERVYQKDPATKAEKLRAAEELLAASTFMALRVRAGDDAGCRNLARPDKPRILGVPNTFIGRGGFHFASLAKEGSWGNPWDMLGQRDDGRVPVFGEANTVKWMLKRSHGESIPMKDSRANDVNLRIVGLLQDSIFQGELVTSEKLFLEMFPDTQGNGMLLADAPRGRAEDLRTLLETAFADRGLAATPAGEKVRSYLAVENTYLSTFQILGGFGLLLGACGLAVVMLRNAAERRGELALLRAIGLGSAAIRGMIRAENVALLLAGIGIGLVAALVSIAPLIITGEASFRPLFRVLGQLIGVIVVGLAAASLAIRSSVRAPIISALRNE